VPGATDDWSFGEGAGFYVDATTENFSKNFNMYSYVTQNFLKLSMHTSIAAMRIVYYRIQYGRDLVLWEFT